MKLSSLPSFTLITAGLLITSLYQPVVAASSHEFFGFHAGMSEKSFMGVLGKIAKVTKADDALTDPGKYLGMEAKGIYCFGDARSPLFGCLFSQGVGGPILRLFANFSRLGKLNRITLLFRRDPLLEISTYQTIAAKLKDSVAQPDVFSVLTKPAQDSGTCGENGQKCQLDRYEWNEGKRRAKALLLSTLDADNKRHALTMEFGEVTPSGIFYFSMGK